jgi:energy-coupling factor transport system substrate-specific component
MILGQGVWTPWQMLGWGLCGVAGAAAGRLLRNRWAFAALALVLGFAFSAFMDVWMWFSFYPHTWEALAAGMVRGFPFQATHAVGNVLIAVVAGPALLRILDRYATRMRTELVWA